VHQNFIAGGEGIKKKKDTMTFSIIGQAYSEKLYAVIHFTGSWFCTIPLIEAEAVPTYTIKSP